LLPYLKCSVWFVSHLRDAWEERYSLLDLLFPEGAESPLFLSLDLFFGVAQLIRLRCLGSLAAWDCCWEGLPQERLLSSRCWDVRGAGFQSRLFSLSFDHCLWLLGQYESPATQLSPVLDGQVSVALWLRPRGLPQPSSRLSSWGF